MGKEETVNAGGINGLGLDLMESLEFAPARLRERAGCLRGRTGFRRPGPVKCSLREFHGAGLV